MSTVPPKKTVAPTTTKAAAPKTTAQATKAPAPTVGAAPKVPQKQSWEANLAKALASFNEYKNQDCRMAGFDKPDIADGYYIASVPSAKLDTWKGGDNKGMPSIEIAFYIETDGDGNETPYQGTIVPCSHVVGPANDGQGTKMLMGRLQDMGITTEDFETTNVAQLAKTLKALPAILTDEAVKYKVQIQNREDKNKVERVYLNVKEVLDASAPTDEVTEEQEEGTGEEIQEEEVEQEVEVEEEEVPEVEVEEVVEEVKPKTVVRKVIKK